MTDSTAKRTLLSQLPVSAEARYDSYIEGSSPLCLKDTRIEVLTEIIHWIDGDGARVFWLHGMAGTGKSTISRTLAKELDGRNQLGASFFFKRAETDRNTIRKLSSTIAFDLACRYPAASIQILEAISKDPNITTKSAHEQFQCLVLKPLSKIQQTKSIVIVVDAIDECDDTELPVFFSLLSDFKVANLPQVKLFLTGRPDDPVLKGFGNPQVSYDGIILHNIEKSIIERDILIFLRHELRQIRERYNNQIDSISSALDHDWPGEPNTQKLLEMADGLFIFAATICKLLSESGEVSPSAQLGNILSYVSETGHAFARTYLPVLERQLSQSLSKSQRKTVVDQITLILGAITVLADPLSLPALARLVDLDITIVELRLNSVRSVIEILFTGDPKDKTSTQIRFLHLSFRDYLLSSEIRDVSPIWVDEIEANRTLSSHCLRILNRPVGGLKFNICELSKPGTLRSTVTTKYIEKCVLFELRYACIYMPYHLKSAASSITDNDPVHQFLLLHLLHWLEALSFLGRAFKALSGLDMLHHLLHVCWLLAMFQL